MSNDKIIERLKKLFALGQSSNQHEAELAMAKASEIMTEHQISMTDVDLSDDGDVVKEEVIVPDVSRSIWLSLLADASANLYDAQCFRMALHNKEGLRLLFIGTPADIMAARMTFDHLYSSWKSIVKVDMHKLFPLDIRSFKRSHGIGFSSAISSRVKILVAERKKTVKSSTGRDLVLVKGNALEDFMKGMNVRRKNIGCSDSSGYGAGYERGQNVPIHGALKEGGTNAITHRTGT